MVPTHTAGWSLRRRIADVVPRVFPGRHLHMFWLDA